MYQLGQKTARAAADLASDDREVQQGQSDLRGIPADGVIGFLESESEARSLALSVTHRKMPSQLCIGARQSPTPETKQSCVRTRCPRRKELNTPQCQDSRRYPEGTFHCSK